MCQMFGRGEGRTRHGQKVARYHHEHHECGRQYRVTGHEQAGREKQNLHDLVDDRAQRIGQDALEGGAAFLD